MGADLTPTFHSRLGSADTVSLEEQHGHLVLNYDDGAGISRAFRLKDEDAERLCIAIWAWLEKQIEAEDAMPDAPSSPRPHI